MFKKIPRLLILLLSIVTLTIFLPSKTHASLFISGESFETFTDGWGITYFPLDPIMEKLGGVKSSPSDSMTFQYIISHDTEKDILIFDKDTNQIKVNGNLIEPKYYKDNNQIYVPFVVLELMNTLETVDSGLIDTFILIPPKYHYTDIAVYNLGTDEYTLPNNIYETSSSEDALKHITYDYTGSVCVPSGQKLPLVIFLHGSYLRNSLSTYYDLGFSDNMKALANEGFVSLGLNLTPVYSLETLESDRTALYEAQKALFRKILKKHLQALINSVNNDSNPYAFEMKDKIDFNNIILVGHSRGGQNLFLGYEILKEMGLNVKGTISIAPANYWPPFTNYPDIPASIILPQLDGDVHTLDGRQIFDTMRLQERNSDLHLIYLYNANHNNFNSLIFKLDNSFIDEEGNVLKEPMPDNEQRTFASKYIVDFSKACIKNGSLSPLLYNQDGILYNQKVLISFYKGNSTSLFEATSDSDFKNLYGNFEKIIASNDKQKHTAGNLRLPGLSNYYPLALLKFRTIDDKLGLNLLNTNNFKPFDTLCFEIMQDSTDSLNKNINQMLDITLVDHNGVSFTISTPPNTYALQYQPGEMARIPLRDQDVETIYSNLTPLSTLMIPLSDFSNTLDFSNISRIEISPSESVGQGSFVLQSIYLSSINSSSNSDKIIFPNNSDLKTRNLTKIIVYICIICILCLLLFIFYRKKSKSPRK